MVLCNMDSHDSLSMLLTQVTPLSPKGFLSMEDPDAGSANLLQQLPVTSYDLKLLRIDVTVLQTPLE